MAAKKKNKVGRPLMYKTPEDLQKAIDNYFDSCFIPLIDKHGNIPQKEDGSYYMVQNEPFTVIGLADALGFKDRQSLIDYNEREEFSCIITRAKLKCEKYANNRLFDRDGVNGAKFTLINNFKNYSDKKELEVTDNQAIQAILDALPEETRKQVAETVKEKLKKIGK